MPQLKKVRCSYYGHRYSNGYSICPDLGFIEAKEILRIVCMRDISKVSVPSTYSLICMSCHDMIGTSTKPIWFLCLTCGIENHCTSGCPCIACKTELEWERVFQEGGIPDDIPEVPFKEMPLHDLLFYAEMASSKSEARRLIKQNAVKINNQRLDLVPKRGDILSVGKRKVVRLR